MKKAEYKFNSLGLGIEGLELTKATKELLQKLSPKLIILFNRNINNTEQVQKLISEVKIFYQELGLPRPHFCIDVEGGLVNRLRNLDQKDNPLYQFKKAEYFAQIYETDSELAKQELYKQFTSISKILNNLGVDINLAPVADLSCISLDKYGRTYGAKPEQVIALSKEVIRALIENGIMPVLKHAPGLSPFGKVDSHFDVPFTDILPEDLARKDMLVFKELCSYIREFGKQPKIMVSHGIYNSLCSKKISASLNPEILNYLNHNLGDVEIITDDLCMGGVSIPVDQTILGFVNECLNSNSNYIPLFCHPEHYSKDIVELELLGVGDSII